jgi:glucose-1-phosphate thymidylyltransferase
MGTRLLPLTSGISKQLMPVYDKPMIYYPLTTLMLSGVREIAIITRPDQRQAFQKLLGDGSEWGLNICYLDQHKPNGIAESLLIAQEFLSGNPSALALGDNLFHGSGLGRSLSRASVTLGAKIFGFRVSNPNDYGVVVLDANNCPEKIIEKPEQFVSDIAIPGLYFFDSSAPERTSRLSPSPRGELEIADLLKDYLSEGSLSLELLPRGTVWLDTGTIDSLAEAADYVRVVQKRQGTLIGSPEEASWRLGLIDDDHFRSLGKKLAKSDYGRYLLELQEG